MKNLFFSTGLLLCFFILMIGTPAQAITATTASTQTETKPQISAKQAAKIERLKKKLSKKMAKIKTKETESDKIREKAKMSYNLGISSLVLAGLSFLGFIQPLNFLLLFSLFTVPCSIIGIVHSHKTIKTIQKSEHPELYEKEMKEAKRGRDFSIGGIISIVLFVGFLIKYIVNYVDF